MNIKKILLLILGLLLLIGSVGCGKDAKDSIGIRGNITEITMSEDNVLLIMVEGKVESDTVYDKARVRVVENTAILKASGEEIPLAELEEGMMVEIVFQGGVAQSYPVQGQAKSIRVVE